MEIYKIKSKAKKDGFYPIPKNLVNRMMFCYPNLGDDTYGYKKRRNLKVNAIVCMLGELYKNFSIDMMGYDVMSVTYTKADDTYEQVDFYMNLYQFDNGYLYLSLKEEDYTKYIKHKELVLRKIKLNKLRNIK